MQYEVDYMPVGEGEKSGDAICLRFGNLAGPREEQTVVVIDGGDKKSGDELVSHIREFYGTNKVDYVVSTHPDSDHASGLCTVLSEMEIGMLLMHRPWDHVGDVKDAFSDGRWTERGLSEKVEKSLKHARELEDTATRKGIPIREPFQGEVLEGGAMRVLGPSQEFYRERLVHFRSTPTPVAGLLGALLGKAEDAVRYIEDRLDIDILTDDEDGTSAENNTSVVLLLDLDGHRLLFTGDAGKTALLSVIEHSDSVGISLEGLTLLHVPHHGSRRNINSKILKKINGPLAYISASGENKKHPSKRVTNALKKHGAEVIVTRKQKVLNHNGGNSRGWYGVAPVEPFYAQVEE